MKSLLPYLNSIEGDENRMQLRLEALCLLFKCRNIGDSPIKKNEENVPISTVAAASHVATAKETEEKLRY